MFLKSALSCVDVSLRIYFNQISWNTLIILCLLCGHTFHELWILIWIITRKGSKYGVFSGPYFPAFRLNTERYGPEKAPYLDTFHALIITLIITAK